MVKNCFAKGPEGWCSYDYHASVIAGAEIFVMTSWRQQGGVNGGGYIWTDHHRWSADTPERPVSILALIRYRQWFNEDPVDLRGAELSCYLRGDGLNLNTAQCYFWAHIAGNRWHCHGQPIAIPEGKWADHPTILTLTTDASQWYRSWLNPTAQEATLDQVLAGAQSYGFSFVGFGSEVSGRLALGEFEIKTR
jgi:hypothetical protein